MGKFKDKVKACWKILTHKEYAVFYTDSFDHIPTNSGCYYSDGMFDKKSNIFRESIAEFVKPNN